MSFTHFHLDPGESKTIAVDGRTYTLRFDGDQVALEGEEPFSGSLRKELTFYRGDTVLQLDRKDEQVVVRVFSKRGSFDKRSAEWRQLASAFYALAHGDDGPFGELPEHILRTDEGGACRKFFETRDADDMDTAGRLITGTRHWFVYLGRG